MNTDEHIAEALAGGEGAHRRAMRADLCGLCGSGWHGLPIPGCCSEFADEEVREAQQRRRRELLEQPETPEIPDSSCLSRMTSWARGVLG